MNVTFQSSESFEPVDSQNDLLFQRA